MEDTNFLERLGIYFLVFIFLSSIFEIGLLIFGFIYADKVECNLLWCTFTSGDSITIKDTVSNYTVSSTSQCFINGREVNCSELDNYTKRFLP